MEEIAKAIAKHLTELGLHGVGHEPVRRSNRLFSPLKSSPDYYRVVVPWKLGSRSNIDHEKVAALEGSSRKQKLYDFLDAQLEAFKKTHAYANISLIPQEETRYSNRWEIHIQRA